MSSRVARPHVVVTDVDVTHFAPIINGDINRLDRPLNKMTDWEREVLYNKYTEMTKEEAFVELL